MLDSRGTGSETTGYKAKRNKCAVFGSWELKLQSVGYLRLLRYIRESSENEVRKGTNGQQNIVPIYYLSYNYVSSCFNIEKKYNKKSRVRTQRNKEKGRIEGTNLCPLASWQRGSWWGYWRRGLMPGQQGEKESRCSRCVPLDSLHPRTTARAVWSPRCHPPPRPNPRSLLPVA